MEAQRYPIRANRAKNIYSFTSHGVHGPIKKLVEYSKVKGPAPVYNLAFGDLMANGEIDDLVASANGDSEIVLATVAASVLEFTNAVPYALIYVQGSTPSRTRLYQMGINKFYGEIRRDFEIFGALTLPTSRFEEPKWEKFRPGRNSKAFMAKRIWSGLEKPRANE